MNISLVASAASEYAKGNYFSAINIYDRLSKKIGKNFFRANIELCEKKLIKKQREKTINKSTFIEESDIDFLFYFAKRFADKRESPVSSAQEKIAIVAENLWCHNKNGYALRVQKIARNFQKNGWSVNCFTHSFVSVEKNIASESIVEIDGVDYFFGHWPRGVVPVYLEDKLRVSIEIFVEWFRSFNPKIVVAIGDFFSTIAAIVAAKQLSIPVVKDYLHYADSLLNENYEKILCSVDFKKKFTAEQACLNLAENSFYFYPDSQKNYNDFFDLMPRFCREVSKKQPLSVLKAKDYYAVTQSVEDGGLYYLELSVEDAMYGNPRGVLASFQFIGSDEESFTINLPDFSSSKNFPQYRYVDTSSEGGFYRVLIFNIPPKVNKVSVDIVAFATQGNVILRHAKIGKVTLDDVARWLSCKIPAFDWIKAVEPFVHKEGAVSLRLALLHYKHQLSKQTTDQHQLDAAIEEMVELDRFWLPEIVSGGKNLYVKPTDKLTVAHLHKTAYPYENTGGAIRCLNTALSQQRIGIDPYIITPIGYPRSAGVEEAKNHEFIEGIEHFRIGANADGLRGISLPDRTRYSVFHIAKLLKQRGANVIHAASGVRGYELALQALALKRLTGLPLLYEVRSFHEHTWTPVRNDVMELEKTQLRVIKENFCMAEADFVTTISYSMKKILIERGVAPEKIEVIPNAIDESKYLGKTFLPMPIPALEGAEMVVGYISNMSRREGHQYLIRAIHQLRQQTGRDIRGLLVGNGPERDNLERLAAELGIKEVIAFPGEVDHSQINAYYKAIDLFVIPRIPDYAADWVTPLKPYEAMALERPIIVSDLPALKEIVGEHEERGLVAKPADVESLVIQIQRYINEPEMRQRKVKTAKDWVFAERTWSANAKRYEAIYRRLMLNHDSTQKESLHA